VLDPRRRAHALGHRHERVAHEHARRIGVVQDVGDLVRGEPVIHGHADRAQRAQRGERDDVFERVVRVHDRVLAGTDTQSVQRVGEAVPCMEKFFPRQRARAVDERGAIGVLRGVNRHDVHGGGESTPGWPGLCTTNLRWPRAAATS
jgi:hypothetical protein